MKFLLFVFTFFIRGHLFTEPQILILRHWATDFTRTLSSSELENLNSQLQRY